MAGLWVILTAACSSPDDDDRSSVDGSDPVAAPSSTADDDDPTPGPDAGAGDAAEDEDGDASGDDGAGSPGGPLLRGDELAERLAELGGQLALGNGPALAVSRPDGEALQVLGVDDESAAQPTWSRDGSSLAWSSSSQARQAVLIQPFDGDGLPEGEPMVSEAEGFPVFYLQWSPDDRRLAFLRSAIEPGEVEFGFVEPGQAAQPAARDRPFFVAWSPGSDRVLAHVGQRTVELYDPEAPAAPPRVVLAQGDGYSAPGWIDDERAVVVADGALAVVTVADGTIEPLEPVDGPVRFVVSPDGRYVAYQRSNRPGDGTLTASVRSGALAAATGADEGGLVVLDLATGQRRVVGDDSVAAWDWSPDGSRLAWLSLRTQGRLVGHWNFWSVDGTEPVSTRTPDFGLSRTYAEIYLPFFAQYAHSVTGWAPDSSAYAFAGNVAGDRGVWIQLIDEAADAVQVTGGDFVTWGSGPTPSPGAGASAA